MEFKPRWPPKQEVFGMQKKSLHFLQPPIEKYIHVCVMCIDDKYIITPRWFPIVVMIYRPTTILSRCKKVLKEHE